MDTFTVTVRHDCHDPFAHPSKHVLQARERNGHLVGVLAFTRSDFPDPDRYDESSVRITVLEVHPRLRRRRIAAQLFDELHRLFVIAELDPGSFTADGAAFWQARTGAQVRLSATLSRERPETEWYEGADYKHAPVLAPVSARPGPVKPSRAPTV